MYESLVGNWCAAKGTTTDATIFRKIDIESIATELEDLGLNRYGYHRMYNGITGEAIDTEIFMGPVYYQRLQKFTVDAEYAISRGPSDKIVVLVRCKILASRFLIGDTFKLQESLVIQKLKII